MNRNRILIRISGVLLCLFIMGMSLIDRSFDEYIWIEAEDADDIEQPFEAVDHSEASGGKAVISHLGSDEYVSSLTYPIEVEKDGKYRFLANCYWPGGCNNSFIIQFDEGNKYVFGNDKQFFETWHWVKGPVIELSQGTHTLRIWNKEAYAGMDRFLLTQNIQYIP